MIDPAKACLFIPAGLSDFKRKLFDRIGAHIKGKGGRVVHGAVAELGALPADIVPIIGCTPDLRPLIDGWLKARQTFVYWDRGYFRRVFATWLPRGENGGFYRWHVGSYQLQALRDVPADRWEAAGIELAPWAKGGRHIVIAAPTRTYSKFHRTEGWIADTIDLLARHTDRQIVIRDKESKRPLQADIAGAHALVTHGSIAGVEAAILGCPVFVDRGSAAALVGSTDLRAIETPVYPDREPWVRALAYSQFSEPELVDGMLWRLLQ